jgi:alcohol dehydrogenase class IV
MITKFNIAALPELNFGAGKISVLPDRILTYGKKLLLITGAGSFINSPTGTVFLDTLKKKNIDTMLYRIACEPSPGMIDDAVGKFFLWKPDCVVAIGGGSVLDAGKAISAMLLVNKPVKLFLEGVGSEVHPGVKVPFIAVPTTSGTGSEATKNAVLSEVGPNGFKKSLRHNNFVPDIAIVDPDLTMTCTPHVTAASGMDAFTQLLESYLSTTANPVTDALALEGLACVSRSLRKAFHDGSDREARVDMSLASYLSGVTLANAGLGLVHGFASVIGGLYPVSHGVICSTLMPATNSLTVEVLRKRRMEESLSRYATVGKLFSSAQNRSNDYYIDSFIEWQDSLKDELKIPKLGTFLTSDGFESIAKSAENKNNPVELGQAEKLEILTMS